MNKRQEDIGIEKNIIKSIRNVGYPGVEIRSSRRPKLKKDGREINANGMYIHFQVLLTCTDI